MDHRPAPGLALRPYQDEAIARSLVAMQGGGRALVVIPTAGGKTVVFSEVARRLGGRTLILVHRDELAKQALETMRLVWPQVGRGRVQGAHDDVECQVVAASVPTLVEPRRLARYLSRGRAQLVIVDEAHHATAGTWRRVIGALGAGAVLGVTATPVRMDQADIGDIFGLPVYQIGMLELIAQGYLSDLRGLEIQTSLNMDGVRRRGGDFNSNDLARVVDVRNRNELAVRSWQRYARGRRTIASAPTSTTPNIWRRPFATRGSTPGRWSAGSLRRSARRALGVFARASGRSSQASVFSPRASRSRGLSACFSPARPFRGRSSPR